MSESKSEVSFSDIRLGIVCPMANERSRAEEFVGAVLEQCRGRGFRSVKFFAVFDNACTDGTFEMLKAWEGRPGELELVWAPENECVVDAYVRGYREALGAGCEWVLEIDASFSHQPEEIPQFFDRMREGYDCVFGSRFCEGGKFTDRPFSRYFVSRAGSILANIMLGTKLKDMTSGFEMFTSAALERVLEKGIRSRGHFFQTEIKAYCRGMRIVEVPIHYRAPSTNVDAGVVGDAFSNLWRLFRERLAGKL